jgi:hypothetical protein
MSLPGNLRAARRRIHVPNPLKAADDVWKAAAGPTAWPKNPPLNPHEPPIVLAGTKPRRRRGAAGYDKGSVPG